MNLGVGPLKRTPPKLDGFFTGHSTSPLTGHHQLDGLLGLEEVGTNLFLSILVGLNPPNQKRVRKGGLFHLTQRQGHLAHPSEATSASQALGPLPQHRIELLQVPARVQQPAPLRLCVCCYVCVCVCVVSFLFSLLFFFFSGPSPPLPEWSSGVVCFPFGVPLNQNTKVFPLN